MIVRDFDADEDPEDWEYPDDEDDDDETMSCPHCRASIYDDAERCPKCGSYLSREDAPWRKPWWLLLGVFACLGVVTWWILHP